jgi:hypothetical protein
MFNRPHFHLHIHGIDAEIRSQLTQLLALGESMSESLDAVKAEVVEIRTNNAETAAALVVVGEKLDAAIAKIDALKDGASAAELAELRELVVGAKTEQQGVEDVAKSLADRTIPE